MIEVKIVREKYLSSDMQHVFTWKDVTQRDAYFDKKKNIKHMGHIHPGPNLTSMNVDYDLKTLLNYDYLYYDDGTMRYYYFITNKIYHTERITTLMLKLDVWTTYQFYIDLKSAFVERCHQDRWAKIYSGDVVQKYIPNKFIDLEGLNPGEYRLTHTLDVASMSDTVIYSSSVPIGVFKEGDVLATNDYAGYADGELWKEGMLSSKGFRFIKGYEGFAPRRYQDPGGYWTVGYGITKHGEVDIYNEHISRAPVSEAWGAQQAYKVKNKRYAKPILEAFKAMGCNNQNQFDALVSLAYNAGTGSVTGSNSLTNIIKKDPNNEQAIRGVWEKFKITSGGQVLSGLKARRKEECDMFFGKTVKMRPIAIINASGQVTSSKVTDNNGNGWLPSGGSASSNASQDADITGYKEFSNEFGDGWLCPVKGMKVSSVYGNRKHPVTGKYKMHYGVDIAAPTGTTTVASKSGKVTHVGWENPNDKSQGFGLRVWITHADGYRSVYPHLSKASVKVGDTVKRGQKVGEIGSTGSSTGPHCHWEIRNSKGQKTNPAPGIKVGHWV